MNIFILEDDAARIEWFTRELADHNLMIVNTTSFVKSLLENIVIDIYFLDHDLGNKVYQPSDTNSGMHVANILACLMNHLEKSIFVIHSWNIPADRRVFQVPFGSFNKDIIHNHE